VAISFNILAHQPHPPIHLLPLRTLGRQGRALPWGLVGTLVLLERQEQQDLVMVLGEVGHAKVHRVALSMVAQGRQVFVLFMNTRKD
jgi:hypothetical protein